MAEKIYYSSMAYSRYEASGTLPSKFERMLKKYGPGERLNGKRVAIKMHVGAGTTYSTIPPVFVRTLVDYVKECGGDPFITDHNVHTRHPERRGYTEENLGCPVLDDCAITGKYYYEKAVDYKKFKHCDVAGLIHDADFFIDFSHVKGHGVCGYGGACKNIAMGCVTDRTRREIHSLEGGLVWDGEKCIHCNKCIDSCNHEANKFCEKTGAYRVNYHHCTLCQHCMKVCPVGAITADTHNYTDFQEGMALCTKTVLDTFEPENRFFINLLISITALCDCWGMTTPSLVPDIGIVSGYDIVAVEAASLDLIKVEDLIPAGVPSNIELGKEGHLFERLHGKNPYIQLDKLAEAGLGTREYETVEVK